MQRQVGDAEADLAHLAVGGAERPRPLHPLEQLLRDRRARLEVAREQVERPALPAPVLHDLRRQLDEVPGHVGAGQRAHFDAAQAVVQQVAELVKDRLDFAVGEQCRAAAGRRVDVAAHQPEMRLEALGRRTAGDQRPHPGAAALVLPRIPVGVEAAQQRAALVADGVVFHRRIPNRRARLFDYADAEQPLDQIEQARDRALQREVRAQHLLVELVERRPLLLGVIGDVPRLQLGCAGAFQAPPEGQQLFVLAAEVGLGLMPQIVEKLLRPVAAVSHAVFQHQVGEIAVADQRRLLPPQIQDAADQRAVVPLPADGASVVGAVDLLAGGGVIQVGHQRDVAGRLEREAPAGQALSRRALPGGLHRAGRQPGQLAFLGDDQIKGIGGIQHVLAESRGQRRQLDLDLLQPRLACRLQFGAVAPEGVDGLGEEAPPCAGERLGLRAGRVLLDRLPQAFVQGNRGVKRAGLRLDGVVGGAQLRIGGHRFQVPDHGHGVVRRLGERVQGRQRVLIGARPPVGRQRFEPFTGLSQQFADRRLDVLGANLVKRDAELDFEKWVLSLVRHSFPYTEFR